MTVATVALPRPQVDTSAFDALTAGLAPELLAGRDDVAAAIAGVPAPRVVLPFERHDVEQRRLVSWYGRLRVDAGTLTHSGYSVEDGLTFYLRASVGGMRVMARDHSREFRREAQRDVSPLAVVVAAAAVDEHTAAGGVITEWSARSRMRMVETLAGLDYSPMDVAGTTAGMVTLTYPGDWLAVAPDGQTVKDHLGAFRKRWTRAYGWAPVGVWKLEFQRRGAPHLHLYLPCPTFAPGHSAGCSGCVGPHTFEQWLSWTWAAIVGADVETGEFARHLAAGTGVDFAAAARYRDHRRVGMYFLKHGTKTRDDKEYQHVVPAAWQEPGKGPGRFWGRWGLARTDVLVPVDVRQYLAARRLLRRAARARARSTAYRRAMREAARQGLTGAQAVRYAAERSSGHCRSLGARGGLSGGFLLSSDGVRLAQLVAYWLRVSQDRDELV